MNTFKGYIMKKHILTLAMVIILTGTSFAISPVLAEPTLTETEKEIIVLREALNKLLIENTKLAEENNALEKKLDKKIDDDGKNNK